MGGGWLAHPCKDGEGVVDVEVPGVTAEDVHEEVDCAKGQVQCDDDLFEPGACRKASGSHAMARRRRAWRT